MIHYHGTPITPRAVLHRLAGRNFCVSFAQPQDVRTCHDIGQTVLLDNGAFTAWRKHGALTAEHWRAYYAWCDGWLDYPTTWAIIPDVIDGGAAEQDRLIADWPHGVRGAPVWHMDEPVDRLLQLADDWPRVCIGSAGPFRQIGTTHWHDRMTTAFNAVAARHRRLPWLHMLRGMAMSGGPYPFASVDSTDVARNHSAPQNDAYVMARRWDAQQTPARWRTRPTQIGIDFVAD